MPVDMRALANDHGIPIEVDGKRGIGIPFSAALLETLDREDLNRQTRQKIVPGDMLTATVEIDARGEAQRSGGYLKLAAPNDLTLLIPREDEPGTFTRVGASNTRDAAAKVISLHRDARYEVEEIAREHEEATRDFEAARGRGEDVEAPERRAPRHDPAVFRKFDGFIAAAESSIAAELGNPFATAQERQSELLASYKLRKEQSQELSPEEMQRVAQAESLREQIARLSPDHPMARQAIVAPWHGDGEPLKEGIQALREAGAGRFSPVAHGGIDLMAEMLATFTRMPPSDVMRAQLSTAERRMFEQAMGRHENEEIAAAVTPRIEAVAQARMPGYQCEARFFSARGVDYMMINDVGGAAVYAADSTARTQDLDIERLCRAPTREDVPSEAQIADLRQTLSNLTFDNGGAIAFRYFDDPEEDDPAPGA